MTTSAPSSRQRWLVPVVVVVLSVTVGGGLLARELYRRPDQPADDTSVSVPATSSASSGEPATGDNAVGMTPDAANHPQHETVQQVLETYFRAINTQNYQLWTTVVSAERVSQQPLAAWKSGVRSTKDSEALVYRIERGSGSSLRVLVAFKSEQNPEDAPDFFPEPCIKWRLVMPMIVEKSALKIDAVESGVTPEHQKC
ncbi:MAG TPA: hypothetical protein VGL47_18405 [Amycolatopsis sp.]|uniref:Secreted protein n=1 Tax=Amycolatopsis nalaikhensis TaxID=715472 RepID=A0ABY8XNN7_9PSEU|nr:hypothetical protein [Amycolatopsis sp. 2-2]WIV57162.1 hypothetical protein QP939_00195 [Amycolatopsis sp. 2-2]